MILYLLHEILCAFIRSGDFYPCKGLQWWEMSRSDTKVHCKYFPGAPVEDMEVYAIPTVRKDPDEIIIHVGTNYLNNQSPKQIAECVVLLADDISQNSSAQLTISGIIYRSDETMLNNKITESNKILKKFATNRRWGFIDNSNLDSSLLNNSGLHLNNKGNCAFARNITNHLYTN